MAETPNYNEASASGNSWQRACRVVIENPYNGQPYITFVEEKIYNLDGQIIKNPVANVGCGMNPVDLLHLDIYMKLNELYTILREQRDGTWVPPVITEPGSGASGN